MFVDKRSPIPAYFQLKNIILQRIRSGEYPEGSLIPSERDLGASYGISRMTVRQALNQLVNEGVLNREKGRGTFVTRTKLEQRNIMSFSDTVRLKGMVPSTRVLHLSKDEPAEDVRLLLELQPGEKVYVLRRLRLANATPVGIEEDYIPEKLCPGLDNHDLTSSLYSLFKEQYNHTISFLDNVVESSRPSREERELLEIAGNTPVLRVSSVNHTGTGVRLFHERSAYRSDEYKYSMRVYVNRNIE